MVALRYIELPPERIYNWLDQFNCTAWLNVKSWHDTWWEPETVSLRKQFAMIWREEFDKITGHFSKLEHSIAQEGIITPVSCVSGPPRDQFLNAATNNIPAHVPPEYQDNINDLIYTQPFGGSRVIFAHKFHLNVPCVVHDFSNLFPDAPLVTSENYQQWFGGYYRFTSQTPHIRLQLHHHLSGRYNGMNQDTRNAQREANKITKERMGV